MDSIREEYITNGVENFYEKHKNDYENPHKKIIQDLLQYAKANWNLGENLLDFCCGSGEVSQVFLDKNIIGNDPYTYKLYTQNTNKHCYQKSFKDIVENGFEHKYDTIISSFAMHLCEESMLPSLLWRIKESTNQLIIITPHKRPMCENIYEWELIESKKLNKVTMKLYRNN